MLRICIVSYDSLFVIFKLHNDWFYIFALTLPFSYALFSIWIELLLRLILQSCVSESGVLFIHEICLRCDVLFFWLFLEIICQLNSSLSFFLSFLLLSNGKFFISKLPEFGKLNLLSLFIILFLVFSVYLICSTFLNCCLHFSSSSFLLFE